MSTSLKYIIVGALNTDIFAFGIPQIPTPGGYEYGNAFSILPGGKGRNIADMLSRLIPKKSIAMISKTVRDRHGLWRVPYDSLKHQGIDLSGVTLARPQTKNSSSPVAIIFVEKSGTNRIIVVPSQEPPLCLRDFNPRKKQLLSLSKNNGFLILSLELPDETIKAVLHLAKSFKIQILLDPGGVKKPARTLSLLKSGSVFFIKPNEEETHILTGIHPRNDLLTKKAAHKLIMQGAKNVLITRGAKPAFFASKEKSSFIPTPKMPKSFLSIKDETGCGDQTIAVFAYAIGKNLSPFEASTLAIRGGTLQFHKQGVIPIRKDELLTS